MRRTQISLDEVTYQALKREAHQRSVSMSEIVRELIQGHLCDRPRRELRLEDFTFIGSGANDRPDLEPLSERHDDALNEGARW